MSKQLTLPPALATCNLHLGDCILHRLARQNMYINKNIFMGCMLRGLAATATATTHGMECLPNTKSRA